MKFYSEILFMFFNILLYWRVSCLIFKRIHMRFRKRRRPINGRIRQESRGNGVMRKLFGVIFGAVILSTISSANAVISHNQNVTPDVIFGSGNSNGNFTVDRNGGVEIGLRAKIPFVGTTHSNGDGTFSYSHAEQESAPDSTFCPAVGGCWNFDWSVNTDFDTLETTGNDNATGNKINDFTYRMGLDFDPSLGTNFLIFDPITPNTPPLNVALFDHSIGDNDTANGDGLVTNDAETYASLINRHNVVQNSWRYAFFPIHPTLTYDPTVDGTYDIFLEAIDNNQTVVARSDIQVIIGAGGQPVPEPGTLALFGVGLLGLGLMQYRRKTA